MEDEKLKTVPKRRPIRIALLIVASVILLLGISGVWLYLHNKSAITIPVAVRRGAQSPIYIPTKLPGDYKIDPESFNFQESVVIFQATDSASGHIAFTEQRRPGKSFNFDEFYSKQITSAKTLNKIPRGSIRLSPSVQIESPDLMLERKAVRP